MRTRHCAAWIVVGALLGLPLAGCAANGETVCCPQAGAGEGSACWMASYLFFGMSSAGGGQVTEAQWQEFVDEVVTPRFPDGLTVLAAKGQWRASADKPVEREDTRVLLIAHPPTPEGRKALQEIRAAYCKRFQQDSVFQIEHPACVTF